MIEGMKLWEQEQVDKLKNDTQNIRRFYKEIEMTDNDRLDELHLGFHQKYDLTHEEIVLVKKVFDYLKRQD